MAIPTYSPATLPVIGNSFSSQATALNTYLTTISTWIGAWNTYLGSTGLENTYIQNKAITSKEYYPQIFYFGWSRGYTFTNSITMLAPASIYANFVTKMESVSVNSTKANLIMTFSDGLVILTGVLSVRNTTGGTATINNLRVRVYNNVPTLIHTIYQTQTFAYDIPAGENRIIPLFFVDNLLSKTANIQHTYQFDFDIITNDLEVDLLGSYLQGMVFNQYFT